MGVPNKFASQLCCPFRPKGHPLIAPRHTTCEANPPGAITTRARIVLLRVDGWTVARIATETGLAEASVRYHIKQDAKDDVGEEHNPSPEEIAERCAAIRAEWSEAERQRRAVTVKHFDCSAHPGPRDRKPESVVWSRFLRADE